MPDQESFVTMESLETKYTASLKQQPMLIELNGIMAKKLKMQGYYGGIGIYVTGDGYIVTAYGPASTDYEYEEIMSFKNYLDEKELRAMGQLVSGYLDFAERQAEREQVMTMKDWAEHLDRILTMSGEQLLQGNGSVSRKQAVEKATTEYKKYKTRTLSEVEKDYLDSIKVLEQKTEKK